MRKQSHNRRIVTAAGLFIIVFAVLLGCGSEGQAAESAAETTSEVRAVSGEDSEEQTASYHQISQEEAKEMMAMRLMIGETEVPVTWEENASVEALSGIAAEGPLTIRMSMYGGFEQVGPIGQSIVRDDQQTTTDYGDIVLYSGDQIVVFYGSNSWAYTRLGHIDLPQDEMTELLANGDVILTISGEE